MKTVIFIDVQNDFVTGALRNEDAIKVMPKIVAFAKECVKEGCQIIATLDTHTDGYSTTLEGHRIPVPHGMICTDGWKIVDGLMDVIHDNATFADKNTFGSIDLAAHISKDADEIVLCGFCTDICVVSNALILRAAFPNTKITVLKDLCAGTVPENNDAALKVMRSCLIDVA